MVLWFLFFIPAWIIWFRQFGIIRLLLINSFVLTVLCTAVCGRGGLAQSKEGAPAPPATAKAVYRELCQRCHAADGKGDQNTEGVPDFTRRAWHEHKSDAQLIVSILEGKGGGMPSFGGRLNEANAKELVGRIRAFAPTAPVEKSPTRAAT